VSLGAKILLCAAREEDSYKAIDPKRSNRRRRRADAPRVPEGDRYNSVGWNLRTVARRRHSAAKCTIPRVSKGDTVSFSQPNLAANSMLRGRKEVVRSPFKCAIIAGALSPFGHIWTVPFDMTVRQYINLFYYTIFRWECYLQYLLSWPFLGSSKFIFTSVFPDKSDKPDDDFIEGMNDPKGGISLMFTSMHVTLLNLIGLLALWNVLFGLFHLRFYAYWHYGMWSAVILSIVISGINAPLIHKGYLKDFRKFASRTSRQNRVAAIAVLMIEFTVWLFFIASIILTGPRT
jgi:hypothetical protein